MIHTLTTTAQPRPRLIEPAATQWMVLRTRSRQEKAVARYLAAHRLQFYLPLIDRITVSGRHKSISRVPLFPGYVFLEGELEDAYGAVATRRVCQIVHVRDQSRFIHEIAQIRRALEGGAQLELHPFAAVGRRCRVRSGVFRGIEGIVIERTRPTRLILHVNILGRGASLEIDADLLESCDDPA